MNKILLATVFLTVSIFAAGQPALVETTKIIKSNFNPLQEFVGTVKFEQKSVLAAQNSGVIQEVKFDVGQIVKQNDTLVKVDSDILQAQINSAKANLESAKLQYKNSNKDFERYKNLLESKAITQKEYDDISLKSNQSQLNLKSLESKLDELIIQADRKNIKAPFDGIMIDKNIEVGEWVNAGTKIGTVVNNKKISIIFNIPINIVNGLKVNDIYTIHISNQNIEAKLKAIIPNGDKLTRTFPIKFSANVTNNFIFDGQEAKIKLSKTTQKDGLVVPRDAVIKRFGKDVIFVIDDKNTVQMMPVNIVGYVGTQTSIESPGIKEGMNIVSKGNERIFPQMPVKIINQ